MLRSKRSLRRFAVASVCAAVAVVCVAGPVAAATPAKTLNVAYDVVGTSTVAKTGSTIALGPTTLTTALNPDGTFTGSLPIPQTSTAFNALGLLPVTSDVNFIAVGAATGALTTKNHKQLVSATSQYVIKLSNVKVAGLPAFVGPHCQTAQPVIIAVATPSGGSFDITNGGVLSGTFTIGKFAHCGLTTPLLNQLVPGAGNTVSLTLSNGRIVS
jgi:hypothetical protein